MGLSRRDYPLAQRRAGLSTAAHEMRRSSFRPLTGSTGYLLLDLEHLQEEEGEIEWRKRRDLFIKTLGDKLQTEITVYQADWNRNLTISDKRVS